jgi:hypothetical protein
MFDPAQATRDKVMKLAKKRAIADVKLWSEKKISDSLKEGMSILLRPTLPTNLPIP